jgi:protoporphyrinogen/coproporphyrinogen III oxidase
MTPRIVVIGAGLSGLTTAYSLHKKAREQGRTVDVTVLEASSRTGGNLVTEHHDDLLIDGGADGWVAAKPEGAALCREAGLGDALIETIAANRRVYVAHHGSLVRMPEGVVLGLPTKIRPVLRSPLISPLGKLRMLADFCMPRTKILSDDISLGELVEQRLGRETVAALVEPLLAGIYAGDAWKLSAKSTFPKLLEIARTDRSMLRAAKTAAPARHGGTVVASAFLSLKNGMGSLPDALVALLPPNTVRLNTVVEKVHRSENNTWMVVLRDGTALVADHVVIGLPAHAAAKLVRETSQVLGGALSEIPYTSAATVFFGYTRRDIAHPLDATGFVVPKREGMRLLAGTWVSSKWPGRASEKTFLMRGFLGGLGREDGLKRDDRELVAEARIDLERLMKTRAEPFFTRVFRFTQTSPLPAVGHTKRVAMIRKQLSSTQGLHCIGSAYDGVGIPDSIRLATATAVRILEG